MLYYYCHLPVGESSADTWSESSEQRINKGIIRSTELFQVSLSDAAAAAV